MRVIEAFDEPVRAVAVSPEGRFLAAASADALQLFDWITGARLEEIFGIRALGDFTFTANGEHLVYATTRGVYYLHTTRPTNATIQRLDVHRLSDEAFSGAVAVAPDGKTLVATRAGHRQQVRLEEWELPGWRPAMGVDFWSPFARLAFSPDGEHIAGIYRESFELRFANSGGLNKGVISWEGRQLSTRSGAIQPLEMPRYAFLTFSRHSETVVFGWDAEFQVMETRAGNIVKRVSSPGAAFQDAAFIGSGRLLATVDGSGLMRFWSTDSWAVVREYDWEAGGLKCVTTTADGLAGVCGTDTGQLVLFDVDE